MRSTFNHSQSQIGKASVKDLDTVSQAIKSHYGRMSNEELKVSILLAGQIQSQSHASFIKKNKAIEDKITLAKEVCQQRVLINSRKTDFRISRANIKKRQIVEKKQKLIEEAFVNKNQKTQEEQILENFMNWQKQWRSFMNVMIFLEKIAAIRRASEFL